MSHHETICENDLEVVESRAKHASAIAIANNPIGWLLTILLPIGIYLQLINTGMQSNVAMYVGFTSVALLMWMFSLMSDFIPGFLIMLVSLLLNLAPIEVVLSGFASNGFVLTFSVLGMGVVITTSGLTYRYALNLIKWLPRHAFWHHLALLFTGILFTPIVPTIAGRAQISGTILRDLLAGLDAKDREKSSALLYCSGLDGVSLLSAVFLTSAPVNLIIYGMFPLQEQQSFQFFRWVYAASVTGGVLLIFYMVLAAVFLNGYSHLADNKSLIHDEIKQLGPMRKKEWFALAGIILLAFGILFTSIHKIRIPYIAFMIFFLFLYVGVLSRDDFVKRIDWAFLFLLGSLIGMVATSNYLGIDKLLMDNLRWLGEFMRKDFETFILLLSAVILLVRLTIPINSTILIFSTVLLPLASGSGVSPWVVGFIILLMAETSIFTYQSPHITFFRNELHTELTLPEHKIRLFRVFMVLAKLVALYASIPFWVSLGIL